MQPQYYIGIMSGTSMDGADAVLIQMQGKQWQRAVAHSFLPYSDGLRQELFALHLNQYGIGTVHAGSGHDADIVLGLHFGYRKGR